LKRGRITIVFIQLNNFSTTVQQPFNNRSTTIQQPFNNPLATPYSLMILKTCQYFY
jgi:hypothetical protein